MKLDGILWRNRGGLLTPRCCGGGGNRRDPVLLQVENEVVYRTRLACGRLWHDLFGHRGAYRVPVTETMSYRCPRRTHSCQVWNMQLSVQELAASVIFLKSIFSRQSDKMWKDRYDRGRSHLRSGRQQAHDILTSEPNEVC